MMLSLSLALTQPRNGGGGAAPTAYAPQAWTMTQDFSLEFPAASFSNAAACVFHIAVMGNGSASGTLVPSNRGIFGKILAGTNPISITIDAEHTPGFNLTNDNSAGNLGGGLWRGNANDSFNTANVNQNNSFLSSYAHAASDAHNNVWQAWTVAIFTNAATGVKSGVMALNGVQVAVFTEPGTMSAALMGFSMAKWMLNNFLAGALTGADFSVAQVYFHTLANLTGVVTGTGASAAWVPATLAKFYASGLGMVDMSADGSTPLGVQPLIFLDVRPGGDPEVDSLTNRGSLTTIARSAGSTTAQNAYRKPWRAPLMPGETGSQIYSAWMPAFNGGLITDASGTHQFEENYGQDIQVGDKLVWIFNTALTAAQPTNWAVSSTNGAWSLQVTTRSAGVTVFMTRDATAADVTANGVKASAATRPTLTWTAGGGFATGPKVMMLCYRRATPSATSMTLTGGTPTNGTSNVGVGYNAPAITSVPAGPGVAVDVFCPYDWTYESSNLGIVPASGMQLRFKIPGDKSLGSYQTSSPWLWDKRINFGTPTTIAARNYTGDATGAGNAYTALSFALT